MTQAEVIEYFYRVRDRLFMKEQTLIREQIHAGRYEEAYKEIHRRLTRGQKYEQGAKKSGI